MSDVKVGDRYEWNDGHGIRVVWRVTSVRGDGADIERDDGGAACLDYPIAFFSNENWRRLDPAPSPDEHAGHLRPGMATVVPFVPSCADCGKPMELMGQGWYRCSCPAVSKPAPPPTCAVGCSPANVCGTVETGCKAALHLMHEKLIAVHTDIHDLTPNYPQMARRMGRPGKYEPSSSGLGAVIGETMRRTR